MPLEGFQFAFRGCAALVQGCGFLPQLIETEQALGRLVVVPVPHPLQLGELISSDLGFLMRVAVPIRSLQLDHPVKVLSEFFGLCHYPAHESPDLGFEH